MITLLLQEELFDDNERSEPTSTDFVDEDEELELESLLELELESESLSLEEEDESDIEKGLSSSLSAAGVAGGFETQN